MIKQQSFFEEILSPLTFPNGLESAKLEGFVFCSPSFSILQQHSLYLNAEQHEDQGDSHRSLTTSITTTAIQQQQLIATIAILLTFPPHEQHISNNSDDVSRIPIKVQHPPPKTTFKHQSVILVIKWFLLASFVRVIKFPIK